MSSSSSTSYTPMPHTRRLQVYVEIPPSPLTMHRNKPNVIYGAPHVPDPSRKENTPLTNTTTSSAASHANKRKLSDIDLAASMTTTELKAKKPKTDVTNKTKAQSRALATELEFPNGWLYCHQCGKKRDTSLGIQCTFKDIKSRCKIKFCKMCLRNRYGIDIDQIKATGELISADKRFGHMEGEGYFFKCPKCDDVCNCSRCRKAKGLEPTGNLTVVAQRAGGECVATILRNNPTAAGIMPGKGSQLEPKSKPVKNPGSLLNATTSAPKAKPMGRPKTIPKPLPPPAWKYLPTLLTLPDAKARIQIREFVLRFRPLIDISKANLEELECITGVKPRVYDDEDDDEGREMVGWVSEPCVKSIVLGVLGILGDESDAGPKIIKGAIKEIRGAGANLNKIWSILAVLRESLDFAASDEEDALTFPDPLPPPASTTLHTTRSTRNTMNSGIYIAQSAQMIPVLVALIDAAIKTKAVREEIEDGLKECRDVVREKWERVKAENERWETEKEAFVKEKEKTGDTDKKGKDGKGKKKDMNEKEKKVSDEEKDKRIAHKQALSSLDNSLQIAMTTYTARFGQLGRDADGRVYWALSPGVTEREFALDFLDEKTGTASKTGSNRPRGRRGVLDEDDRKGMRKWSWFVAVWGKRPPEDVSEKRTRIEDGEDEDEDDGEQKWWGFWEPEEIRRLAGYVARQSGAGEGSNGILSNHSESGSAARSSPLTDDDDIDIFMLDPPSTKDELNRLVKSLKDYADVLEWRIR